MPLHFEDKDITSKTKGVKSALIVPCNMCPAITVADREKKPFMELFKSVFTSGPFETYLKELKNKLQKNGVSVKIFRSYLYHQWFMCMWTHSRQKQLKKNAEQYDAIIVLGCNSATKTVQDSVNDTNCKIIEGMELSGIMNAKLKFQFPCSFSFQDCRIVPVS